MANSTTADCPTIRATERRNARATGISVSKMVFITSNKWSAKNIHKTNPLPVENFGIQTCSFYRHQSKYNQFLLVVYVEFHLVTEF